MASIIQNKKDGKVVSYRLRVYIGKDASGNRIRKKSPSGFESRWRFFYAAL